MGWVALGQAGSSWAGLDQVGVLHFAIVKILILHLSPWDREDFGLHAPALHVEVAEAGAG